jgi:hypothetical protein
MISSITSKLAWHCGALALLMIVVATVGPSQWVPRTGVHWLVDHFLVYFGVTALICLAWPRPFLVATSLILLAGLLEALQGVTLDRTPDLLSALSGAGGVLTAALLAWIVITQRFAPGLVFLGGVMVAKKKNNP